MTISLLRSPPLRLGEPSLLGPIHAGTYEVIAEWGLATECFQRSLLRIAIFFSPLSNFRGPSNALPAAPPEVYILITTGRNARPRLSSPSDGQTYVHPHRGLYPAGRRHLYDPWGGDGGGSSWAFERVVLPCFAWRALREVLMSKQRRSRPVGPAMGKRRGSDRTNSACSPRQGSRASRADRESEARRHAARGDASSRGLVMCGQPRDLVKADEMVVTRYLDVVLEVRGAGCKGNA